jgi:hypothetical protein
MPDDAARHANGRRLPMTHSHPSHAGDPPTTPSVPPPEPKPVPIREPQPDRMPDEAPNPNPDEKRPPRSQASLIRALRSGNSG